MANAEGNSHTPEVHLEIADFSVRLKGIETQMLLEICPNYAPFITSRQYPVLFEATLHAVNKLEIAQATDKYLEFAAYSDYTIRICNSRQKVDICLTHPQTGCLAHIQANPSFSHCHITYCGNHRTIGPVVNLSMIVSFTFSGLNHKLLLLHAAGIALNNRCCLLLGKSGTGKSTHAQLWLKHVSESKLLIDDCAAVRIMADQTIQVYSTPWNETVPCTTNTSCKLQAFIRLKQAPANAISRLSPIQAFASLLSVCARLPNPTTTLSASEQAIEIMATHAPHFELNCLPDKAAVYCCKQAVFAPLQSNVSPN